MTDAHTGNTTSQHLEDAATGSAPLRQNTVNMPFLVKTTVTFVVFLGIFVGLGYWLGGGFLSAQDRIFDLHQNVPVLLIALGAMTILTVNQFDLSIAAMATLTAYLSVGLHANQGLPMWLSLLCCLGVGVLGGLLNSLLVVRMQVNAFIATIGTSGVFIGLSRVYSNGTVLSPDSLPSWFSGEGSFGSFATKASGALMWTVLALGVVAGVATIVRTLMDPASSVGLRQLRAALTTLCLVVAVAVWPTLTGLVPLTVVALFVIAVAVWILFTRTVFGRYLYATGGNARAARLAGVKVDRQTTMAFVLTGLLSAAGGVVLAANQGSVAVDVAVPMLLPAYAAAFLSTVLLSAGRFHVWGCLLGGLFVVWIRQALIMGGVPFTWAEVVNGAVLIAAVGASRLLFLEKRT